MPKIKRTAKNISALFAGDIGNRFIGFMATAYLARSLGVSSFGLIGIGLAFLSYALTISSNGFQILGVRKIIASKNSDKLASDFISVRLVFSIFAIILTVIISIFIKSVQTRIIVLAYSLCLLPSAILLDWFFQAKEKMTLIVSGRLLGMLGYLILILLLVKSKDDVLRVPYSWFLSGLITSMFFIIMFIRKGKRIRIHISFEKTKLLFLEAFPLGLANFIAQITLFFPPIFLGLVRNVNEAGLYNAAAKLIFLFLILDRVFSFLFFPMISKCAAETPQRLNQVFDQTLKWIVAIAIFSGFLGILLSKHLVLFVFDEPYLNSLPIFQMLMSYFILTLINSVFTYTLIALKQEKTYTFSLFVGSVSFFISVWFLLKIFGPSGIGIGLGIYQAIGLFIMENRLKKFLEIKFYKTVIIPIFLSFAVCLPIILFTNLNIYYKFLVLLINFISMFLLLDFNKQDFMLLKNKLI